jgi:succinoglycan biosynthesis protein ExoA
MALRLPLAGWGWLALMASYVMAATLASFMTTARQGWRLFPLLPLVFACYHFAYGCGFLRGVCDFVILRRGPRRSFTDLTRPTPYP